VGWRALKGTSWRRWRARAIPAYFGQGGRSSAPAVVQVTRYINTGHKAPFSLPQSVALAAGTIVHADVRGGVHAADEHRWE
jgi:hypothetical protein